MAASGKLEKLIRFIADPASSRRQTSIEELLELSSEGLSRKDYARLIQAAAGPFNGFQEDEDHPSAVFLRTLLDAPEPEFLAPLVANFTALCGVARQTALLVISQLKEREAAEAFTNLVMEHGWPGDFRTILTAGFAEEPRHGSVLFPRLLQAAPESEGEHEIYHLCLAYCRAGEIDGEMLAPYADQFLSAYAQRKAVLGPRQSEEGIAWRFEEEYAEARYEACLLLDLLGWVDTPRSRAELSAALEYADPRLVHFAALSLLNLGEYVDADVWRDIAASHEMRSWLYSALEEAERLDLFPEEIKTQPALACGDLVQWLCFPTELGREPDEIELMGVASMDTEDTEGTLDFYMFRFRSFEPHWSAKEGWIAGVAGPFASQAEPTPHGGGATFSAFEPWDKMEPAEHLNHMLQILANVASEEDGEGEDMDDDEELDDEAGDEEDEK
jgi:hypothetical protein